jgi:hypothetical protein
MPTPQNGVLALALLVQPFKALSTRPSLHTRGPERDLEMK